MVNDFRKRMPKCPAPLFETRGNYRLTAPRLQSSISPRKNGSSCGHVGRVGPPSPLPLMSLRGLMDLCNFFMPAECTARRLGPP